MFSEHCNSNQRDPLEESEACDQLLSSLHAILEEALTHKDGPLRWAEDVEACVSLHGFSLPSVELGTLLVAELSGTSIGNPILRTYAEYALALKLVSPLHVIALLANRVHRWWRDLPELFAWFMSIAEIHCFRFHARREESGCEHVLSAIAATIQWAELQCLSGEEGGAWVVAVLLLVELELMKLIVGDWKILGGTNDGSGQSNVDSRVGEGERERVFRTHIGGTDLTMEDADAVAHKAIGGTDSEADETKDRLKQSLLVSSVQLAAKITLTPRTKVLLQLSERLFPSQWRELRQLVAILGTVGGSLSAPGGMVSGIKSIAYSAAASIGAVHDELQINQKPNIPILRALMGMSARLWPLDGWLIGGASIWLPLDIMLEDAVEGKRIPLVSTVVQIAEMVMALRQIDGAPWQDVMLALWLAALRTVSRGCVHSRHIETRLSLLLCIVPMALEMLILDHGSVEQSANDSDAEIRTGGTMMAMDGSGESRTPPGINSEAAGRNAKRRSQMVRMKKGALACSLRILRHFEALLQPPPSIAAAASAVAGVGFFFPKPKGGGESATLDFSPGGSTSVSSDTRGANKDAGGLGFIATGASSEDLTTGASWITGGGEGNLWGLILQACAVRRLVAGYNAPVDGSPQVNVLSSPPSPLLLQSRLGGNISPWQVLMDGARLNASLCAAIAATPATSVAELELVYRIAMTGAEDERAAAASALCGASLVGGWNIQEHAVRLAVKLLCPYSSDDASGHNGLHGRGPPGSYLVHCAPMLSAALAAMSQSDALHIIRLHGKTPELAAALIPICETFGNLPAVMQQITTNTDDITSYTVFFQAFLLLVRILGAFYPPVNLPEHYHHKEPYFLSRSPGGQKSINHEQISEPTRTGSFTLISLLSQYCVGLAVSGGDTQEVGVAANGDLLCMPSSNSVLASLAKIKPAAAARAFLDQFPLLNRWYAMYHAGGVVPARVGMSSVKATVDRLLLMIYRKGSLMNAPGGSSLGQVPGSVPSSLAHCSNSNPVSSSTGEEILPWKPLLAWDVVTATPAFVEAALTACAHGRQSPREMMTGLGDLVDYVPAAVVPIATYLAAEAAKGSWKQVLMNGADWPRPILLSIEQEILNIIAATKAEAEIFGLASPSSPAAPKVQMSGSQGPPSLPLPLAALVNLTMRFKNAMADAILAATIPLLLRTAAACPWPSLPAVVSLLTQNHQANRHALTAYAVALVCGSDPDVGTGLLNGCFHAGLCSHGACARPGTEAVSRLLGHGIQGQLLSSPSSGMVSPQSNASYGSSAEYRDGSGVHGLVAPGALYIRCSPLMHEAGAVAFRITQLVTLLASEGMDVFHKAKHNHHQMGIGSSPTSSSSMFSTVGTMLPPQLSGSLQTNVRGGLHPSVAASTIAPGVQASGIASALLYMTGGVESVISLLGEVLPSWFILGGKGTSAHQSGTESSRAPAISSEAGATVLEGHALARLAILCGMLAWGTAHRGQVGNPSSHGESPIAPMKLQPSSKSRQSAEICSVMGKHLEFMADGMEGVVVIGCSTTTWKAYVTAFVALLVSCTPGWLQLFHRETLQRVAKSLAQWREPELAFFILSQGRLSAVSDAAEVICQSDVLAANVLSLDRRERWKRGP